VEQEMEKWKDLPKEKYDDKLEKLRLKEVNRILN
jgi:hypothetical protein